MRKKIAIALIILALLYVAGGFFALPYFLRPVLEEKLSTALSRQVSIDDIDINPCTLSVCIKGVSIGEKQGKEKFVSFDELLVNVQARSLIRRALIVQEVSLKRPKVRITRLDKNLYSFSDLLKKKSPQQPKVQKKPFFFSVANIRIAGGAVDFIDLPAHAMHKATDINLAIPFVSNIDEFLDIFVQPSFAAGINGTQFTLAGQTKPFKDSLETTLALNLKSISIPFYMGYLPANLKMSVPSGTLDIKTKVSYVQHKGRKPTLDVSGDFDVHSLSVLDAGGRPLLSLPDALITLAPSPVLAKTIHIAKVEIKSPEVFIRKDKDGRLNMTGLVSGNKSSDAPKKEPDGNPLLLSIDTIALSNGTVRYADLSKESPVNLVLDEMNIKAAGISTKQGAKGKIDLSSRLNEKCTVSSTVSVGLKPLVCDAGINVQGLEPGWLQPYFTDKLRIAVTRGKVSVQGTASVEKRPGSKLKAGFAGDIRLADFASVDKRQADDFIKCRGLSLNKFRLGINPGYIDIGTVRLNQFFTRILIYPKGGVNLLMAVRKDEKKGGAPPAPAKKPLFERITVGRVVMDKGRLSFIDKSVKPGYSADITDIGGTIKGISSARSARADVNISAMLNRSAPLLVKGTINPFKENLFVNLRTGLNGLDLSPMTPYSGKFAGYTIEKGKLSLDLTYLINHKDLVAQNNVLIDQFTFGDSVQSPKATKLPVRFAVALLKNKDGKIDLKLPVKGRTDDPKFSVFGVVVQILKNLVVKAAASPFLVLEAMYPGASQLNTMEFAYGSDNLPQGHEPKLDSLIRILEDKPALNLEIRGFADPVQDRQGLADQTYDRKIKTQKLKNLIDKGKTAVSVDGITITPDEYEHYLKKAYETERFSKPTNALGIALSLKKEEMEKLIREHIAINDSDLRLLALSRAQKIQEYLTAAQKIAPSRIFLIEAQSLMPGRKPEAKDSRVDLTLK